MTAQERHEPKSETLRELKRDTVLGQTSMNICPAMMDRLTGVITENRRRLGRFELVYACVGSFGSAPGS